jgi:hypothetical protein
MSKTKTKTKDPLRQQSGNPIYPLPTNSNIIMSVNDAYSRGVLIMPRKTEFVGRMEQRCMQNCATLWDVPIIPKGVECASRTVQ